MNISSPGWGKHAWSNFFAPFNAGATVFVHNYARFNARRTLEVLARHEITTLCAPPDGVAPAHPGGPRAVPREAPRGAQRRRAAQPGGDRSGEAGLGHRHPRRLRPDGDHLPDRQLARPAAEARLDGPADARLPGGAARRGRARRPPRARSVARARTAPDGPHGGLPGRPGPDCARHRATATTGPGTWRAATRTATSPMSAGPTTSSRAPTTASAPSSWRARSSSTRRWPRRRWCRARTPCAGSFRRRSSSSGPARRPRASSPSRSSASCAAGSRPTSASAASSSPTCRRPSPARSGASSCARPRSVAAPGAPRGEREFWQEDFPELKEAK